MTLSGSCQCGAVTVTAANDPVTVRQCWCRDCQKLMGGGPAHNAFFNSDEVSWAGEIKRTQLIPASGTPLERGFCPECGTPLFTQSTARRHVIAVRVGLFDDTSALGPRQIIWSQSAPPWARLDPELPQLERQPAPMPAPR